MVLPQLRIAMTGGALLVSLHLLAEYGAFAMIRFDTFTTAIMVQYQSRQLLNGTAGNMLASVLVFLCLILLLVEVRSRGNARYARIGSGAQAGALRLPLHVYQLPAQLFLVALTALAFGLPLTFVLRWIVAGGPEIWTADEFLPALLQTLMYGLAGALATTVVAFPMAYLAVRHPELVQQGPGTVQLHYELPSRDRGGPGLRDGQHQGGSGPLPDLGTADRGLRVALPAASAGEHPLRPGPGAEELDQAAQSLGKSPLLAFLRVTLRLTAPAAAGGAALVFLAIVNELTATLLLSPNGTRTLATEFWSHSSEIDYAGAAPTPC